MTDRLYDNGPTLEDITTTPGAWHVPEHLRDHYRAAITDLTIRDHIDAEQDADPAKANTYLVQIRDHARAVAGLPQLPPRDGDRIHGTRAWPADVPHLPAYLIHVRLLDQAQRRHRDQQTRDHADAEWETRHTCHACDITDATVTGTLCGPCRDTRTWLHLQALQATAEQRLRRGTTRADLVRTWLNDNPEQAANLYHAVMRTHTEA